MEPVPGAGDFREYQPAQGHCAPSSHGRALRWLSLTCGISSSRQCLKVLQGCTRSLHLPLLSYHSFFSVSLFLSIFSFLFLIPRLLLGSQQGRVRKGERLLPLHDKPAVRSFRYFHKVGGLLPGVIWPLVKSRARKDIRMEGPGYTRGKSMVFF